MDENIIEMLWFAIISGKLEKMMEIMRMVFVPEPEKGSGFRVQKLGRMTFAKFVVSGGKPEMEDHSILTVLDNGDDPYWGNVTDIFVGGCHEDVAVEHCYNSGHSTVHVWRRGADGGYFPVQEIEDQYEDEKVRGIDY